MGKSLPPALRADANTACISGDVDALIKAVTKICRWLSRALEESSRQYKCQWFDEVHGFMDTLASQIVMMASKMAEADYYRLLSALLSSQFDLLFAFDLKTRQNGTLGAAKSGSIGSLCIKAVYLLRDNVEAMLDTFLSIERHENNSEKLTPLLKSLKKATLSGKSLAPIAQVKMIILSNRLGTAEELHGLESVIKHRCDGSSILEWISSHDSVLAVEHKLKKASSCPSAWAIMSELSQDDCDLILEEMAYDGEGDGLLSSSEGSTNSADEDEEMEADENSSNACIEEQESPALMKENVECDNIVEPPILPSNADDGFVSSGASIEFETDKVTHETLTPSQLIEAENEPANSENQNHLEEDKDISTFLAKQKKSSQKRWKSGISDAKVPAPRRSNRITSSQEEPKNFQSSIVTSSENELRTDEISTDASTSNSATETSNFERASIGQGKQPKKSTIALNTNTKSLPVLFEAPEEAEIIGTAVAALEPGRICTRRGLFDKNSTPSPRRSKRGKFTSESDNEIPDMMNTPTKRTEKPANRKYFGSQTLKPIIERIDTTENAIFLPKKETEWSPRRSKRVENKQPPPQTKKKESTTCSGPQHSLDTSDPKKIPLPVSGSICQSLTSEQIVAAQESSDGEEIINELCRYMIEQQKTPSPHNTPQKASSNSKRLSRTPDRYSPSDFGSDKKFRMSSRDVTPVKARPEKIEILTKQAVNSKSDESEENIPKDMKPVVLLEKLEVITPKAATRRKNVISMAEESPWRSRLRNRALLTTPQTEPKSRDEARKKK